jgi:hypothetical protein
MQADDPLPILFFGGNEFGGSPTRKHGITPFLAGRKQEVLGCIT